MEDLNNIKKESKEKNEDNSCFKIIALGGDAKSRIKGAMVKIKESKYSEANKLLKAAEENIIKARNIQHKLLTEEIRGNNMISSILINHAMDILMTAESEFSLINFLHPYIRDLQEKLKKKG
jgi:PTS system cellobiose-specific IIA component